VATPADPKENPAWWRRAFGGADHAAVADRDGE
jgi:hypothetical protein